MSPQSIETAFARFSETLDPEAMAEVFDRAALELRPMARRLSHGRVESEDLIQDTFLAAIEHRASYDPARPLMPWLVGILIRQASAARRRARREVDPSRLDARSPSTPEEELAEGEFKAIVLEALSRLSRRDRDVLVPVLFDGKRAVQIARELGHAPDTIRMRIHRGLSRLRELLPANFALPGLFVLSPGLRAVRREVLLAAARAGGGTALAPLSLGAGVGALGLWLGIGLLAVLALGWQVRASLFGGEPTPAPIALQGEAPGRATQPIEAPAQDLEQRLPAVLARELELQDQDLSGQVLALSGRVAGLEPGEGAAARVEIRGLGPDPIAPIVLAELDAGHAFEADVAPLARLGARRFLVRVEHPDHVPAEARVERGSGARVFAGTLEVPRAWVLRGRVVDDDGVARAGVWVGVYALQLGNKDVNPLDQVRSAADGSFRLRSPSAGPQGVLAFLEGLRPASRLFGALEHDQDLGVLSLEAGMAISGRLRAGAELGLQATLLRCEAQSQAGQRRLRLADRRFQLFGERFELTSSIASSDAQGAFVFRGLGPLLHDLSVVQLPRVDAVAWDPLPLAATVGASAVQAPAQALEIELPWSVFDFEFPATALTRGQEIALDVLLAETSSDSGSRPPSNAMNVRVRPIAGQRTRLQVRPGSRYAVRLHGLSLEGRQEALLEAPAAGECRTILLEAERERERASCVLTLLGAQLPAGERVGVGFFPAEPTGSLLAPVERAALFERDAFLDDAQRLRLDDLPSGKWLAVVRVGGSYSRSFGFLLPGSLELELFPGHCLESSLPTERGGRARVRVLSQSGARISANARLFDAEGREQALQLVALAPESAVEQSGRIVLSAYNELGPLRAGNWRLELRALGHAVLSIPFVVEPERVVEFEARLEAL